MVRRASGLVVPESSIAQRHPIDLVSLVITSSDVGLGASTLEEVAREMSRCPLAGTVTALTGLMARLRERGADHKRIDLDFARAALTEELLAEVVSRIERGDRLVTEHSVLKLIEYALRHCYTGNHVVPRVEYLAWMMLVLNDHLGVGDDADDAAPDLGLYIDGEPVARASTLAADTVANQYFHAEVDLPSLIARFQRRWREMPADDLSAGCGIDLDGIYLTTVGVPFEDLVTVATMVWGMSAQGSVVLKTAEMCRALSWDAERLDSVLELMARDPAEMVAAIDQDEYSGTWSFNAFERFPILRLDAETVVAVNPDYVLCRAYGWLPLFDIATALEHAASIGGEKARGDVPPMSAITNYLRANTERYALEVLESIAPRRGPFKRLWDELELQAAYPGKQAKKVCDAVLEEPGAWVAVEVSSRSVQRKLASAASPQALLDDVLRGVVDKAKQLEATLTRLREDESRLTGRAAEQGRRFVPILLISEGFPLGPVTRAVINDRLRRSNVLQNEQSQPLHIIGMHELELLEHAVTTGRGSLVDLLDAHARSTMAQMNLRDFLVGYLGGHHRPARQVRLWEKALAATTARMKAHREGETDDQ
ncbi:hypothetical protein AB0A74_26365 [Saccharothrix sp. NPDC042600]|uniref:hypothetical protein n=1 Tax=Saccharothrix TaxID=2071 RepID=UPI00340CDD4A|nr:hypothetical protein GCM10017745_46080 [Saccharothrix mutabilis subsp. capreolus]